MKWYQGDQDPSYAQIYDWIDGRFNFLDQMYEYRQKNKRNKHKISRKINVFLECMHIKMTELFTNWNSNSVLID